MTTTGTKTTTHTAREGSEVVMARSFYVVHFVSCDSGAWTVGRIFNTKRAAAKQAAWLVAHNCATVARVMLGGAMEVARFAA